MFRFRKRTAEPLSDVRSAKRWLASLPVNDPLAVQRELKAALEALSGRTALRNPARLAAVFAVDVHTDPMVRTLMAQYADHADRSSRIENQLWHALFELTQAYQTCYAAFAREISDHAHRGRWPALLPELIARQVRHMAQDVKIRLYRSEPWIPAKWAELHAAFTRACTLQFERQPLLLFASDGPTTIEREFLIALILQQGDPGNLTPRQIEWFAGRLEAWSRPLRLSLEPVTAATFYVDLASSSGLRRRSVGALEGRVLFVDLRPVHALLLQNRTELEQALKGESRSEAARAQREYLDLCVKLASRLDPEFKPLVRRGERIPASGAVDAIVGFANICAFLSNDKISAAPLLHSGRSFANTMDLAVFGHSRSAREAVPHEDPRRRLSAFAAPGGSWEMKDMSVSGFRLHAPMSVATEVTLGMLVAIRRRSEETWVMGIVRRMRRLSADNAEIGLQLIASSLAAAEIVEQRAVKTANYSVDGEPRAGRRFRGIYLTFNRRGGEPAVASLIVPPVEYQPAGRYSLELAESARAIRYGRLLEQHTDWVWTVIDAAEPDVASTAAPTA